MKLKPKWQRYLNEYVDFEYITMLRIEVSRYTPEMSQSCGEYFGQIGNRLNHVRGLDEGVQAAMVALARRPFALENFFLFGKLLVGLNPQGKLTMQTVLSVESALSS